MLKKATVIIKPRLKITVIYTCAYMNCLEKIKCLNNYIDNKFNFLQIITLQHATIKRCDIKYM